MALVMKYRLGEVAKDFGVPNKEISSIMAEYFVPAKNHMQVLADEELDVIFEYMTQHNQVENLADMQQNFFAALTSTFWGLVFAIIFKLLDGFLSSRMEDNDKAVDLLLERRELLREGREG